MGSKVHVHAINFLLPAAGGNGPASYHHQWNEALQQQWVQDGSRGSQGMGSGVSITARFWEGTLEDHLVPVFIASTREKYNRAFSIGVKAPQCAG